MKSLAIIPARSGSKGLPDKNIIDINGRPLIDYTIKAALESNCFNEVMVSTDSAIYAEIAKKCGAKVPFLRSEETSSDVAGSWDVVREVLNNYKKLGYCFDYVSLLQPTSPLRTADDIKNAFLCLKGDVKNVVSVTETEHPVQWCFTLKDDCLLDDFAKSQYCNMRRQDLNKHYHENGAIYIVAVDEIVNEEYNLYADSCYAYIMEREHSIDIDTRLDLEIFKAMIVFKH